MLGPQEWIWVQVGSLHLKCPSLLCSPLHARKNRRVHNENDDVAGSEGACDSCDGNDNEEEEFGPILKYDEVMRETEARGATLPLDMIEAAKSVGIRKVLLLRYLDLQVQFLIVHTFSPVLSKL